MNTKITSDILSKSTTSINFRFHKAEEISRDKEISIVKLEETVKNKEYVFSQLEREYKLLKEKYEVDIERLEREKNSAIEQYKVEIKEMQTENKETIEKLTSVYEEKLKIKHENMGKKVCFSNRQDQGGYKEGDAEQEKEERYGDPPKYSPRD